MEGWRAAESWVIVPFVRARICLVFGDLCSGCLKEKVLLPFVGELLGVSLLNVAKDDLLRLRSCAGASNAAAAPQPCTANPRIYGSYRTNLIGCSQIAVHPPISCNTCDMNRTNNRPPIDSLQPIAAPLQPIHTITLDFVIAIPTIPSKNTLWAIEGFDVFDALFIVICKSSKRKLLFPSHERYGAEDWGYILGRQLLFND